MLMVWFSVKGGQGCTTVAASLALARGGRATVVDAAGDVPAVLGLREPTGPGLVDLLSSDPLSVTQTPERLSLRTLMALCDALDCEIADLLERVAEDPPARRRRAAGAAGDDAVVALRPKPARILPRRGR